MGRSVVLAGTTRCLRCSLPPRWCTCNALPTVETEIKVLVLIHRQEYVKPSSTGRLVAHAVRGAACHVYQRATRFHSAAGFPAAALTPGDAVWILHPSGASLPDADARSPRHVVLLDGTWRQAREMRKICERTGLIVRLPDAPSEPSRYWLRSQPTPGHLSTAEAVMGVFRALGDSVAAQALRLHFELHVYASLLARGRREMAERYLGHSPLLTAAPDAIGRLLSGKGRSPASCSSGTDSV